MHLRRSLEGRFLLLAASLSVMAVLLTVLLARLVGSLTDALLLSVAVCVPLTVYAVRRFMVPITRLLTALGDGVASFKDGDFSVSLNPKRDDELGALVNLYNAAGDVLRRERQSLYQRELMLDTVIQSTPWALVLCNANDRVVYSNVAARQLFHQGRRFEGLVLTEVLQGTPETLREAVQAGRDGMFSVQREGEDDIYYLSREHFTLNAQRHSLYLFKQLTRELNRQEVAIWKKVIRVLSHELNNSLAPITSLAHSGRILAGQAGNTKLANVLSTIEERAQHLKSFIDGYARFAKLPAPRIESVDWAAFMASLSGMAPFTLEGSLPAEPGRFDAIQLQQVLINLLKNAHESGSSKDAVTLNVRQALQGLRLDVTDAGPGMSPEVLEQALLPFYSTKQSGTGLGLPLCREIVEAHGGRISLANRAEGGLVVSVWLPQS
ncbi:MAG TPA: ATP-binding protein [Gammaproteobacteria bacterium]|jgi:nitrogen fixation/metabolism regulation signal transduction histidine kinase